MKDLGKGLATCGIWLGVAILGWRDPSQGGIAALFGAFATLFVWGK